MRLITWSFVVIVVLVSSARGAETYVSRDWGFQVDFPAPPQTQEMELNTEFGRAKFARFKAKGADVRAALSVIRYAREAITRQEALVLLKKSWTINSERPKANLSEKGTSRLTTIRGRRRLSPSRSIRRQLTIVSELSSSAPENSS